MGRTRLRRFSAAPTNSRRGGDTAPSYDSSVRRRTPRVHETAAELVLYTSAVATVIILRKTEERTAMMAVLIPYGQGCCHVPFF